jgi:hypothetical protein
MDIQIEKGVPVPKPGGRWGEVINRSSLRVAASRAKVGLVIRAEVDDKGKTVEGRLRVWRVEFKKRGKQS